MSGALRRAEARFGAASRRRPRRGRGDGPSIHRRDGPGECEAQFRPRLRAAAVLEQALEGRALDFCLLLSSLSAVLGGPARWPTRAAHAFLDAFTARHNRELERSLAERQLGPLVHLARGRRRRRRRRRPAYFMTAQEAAGRAARVLSWATVTQLVVSTGDLQTRIDRWIRLSLLRGADGREPAPARSLYARPELAQDYVAPRTSPWNAPWRPSGARRWASRRWA